MWRYGGWVFWLLLVGVGGLGAQEEEDARCLECHASVTAAVVRHDALDEGCAACHEVEMLSPPPDTGAPHTHTLTGDEPGLCQDCHEVPEDPDNVHPPVEDEGCSYCHDPHTAPHEALLRARPYTLCRECHTDVLISGWRTIHAPVDSSCALCHRVHGSEADFYLKAQPPGLCFQCHRDVERDVSAAYPHDPAAEDCKNCHNTHASRDAYLLNAYFPEGPYTVYTPLRFALCWECHEPEDVFGESSGFRTALGKNLHKVHVQRKKGRVCVLCHSPHGSPQEFLLRTGIPFGPTGWVLPLEITPGTQEKQCGTSCHEARSYSP